MTPEPLDPLTLLQRAQQLHDATLRRHSDMLDYHADQLASHATAMAGLRGIQERQERLMETLADISSRLQQTMDAIKDMLDRGNGH